MFNIKYIMMILQQIHDTVSLVYIYCDRLIVKYNVSVALKFRDQHFQCGSSFGDTSRPTASSLIQTMWSVILTEINTTPGSVSQSQDTRSSAHTTFIFVLCFHVMNTMIIQLTVWTIVSISQKLHLIFCCFWQTRVESYKVRAYVHIWHIWTMM